MVRSLIRSDRRTLLKAAGAGVALSSLAFGTTAADEHSSDDASLNEQLETVKSATEDYADPEVAMDDGYELMGPFVPGMGWHFLNVANVEAAIQDGFDLERPQLLTYGDTGAACHGELVLASVEYGIPVGAGGYDDENPPDIFNDEDDSEQWHIHHAAEHVFALPAEAHADHSSESSTEVSLSDKLRTTNWVEIVPGGEPGSPMFEPGTMIVADLEGGSVLDARAVVGSSVHPDLWTLHVWAHLDNPDGLFTPINPDLPASPEE